MVPQIFLTIVLWLLAFLGAPSALATGSHTSTYEKALDLVHAYSGSGDELQQAMKLAEYLSKSAPESGYAQVLYAEVLSTWQLDQNGKPVEIRDQVLAIADEALRLNPRLAQAHVSKARALVRSSLYPQAESFVTAALVIDPTLSGAMFVRAEGFRRQRFLAEAELWYKKFIASTSSASRKANGYGWIATMYQDATYFDVANRKDHISKARDGLKNPPQTPWGRE
jgi:tetratricopeptide (TPR) repeat protein